MLAPKLTAGQARLLSLVARGLPTKQIAAELGVSERAITARLSRLFRAYKTSNRAGLIAAVLSQAGVGLDTIERIDWSGGGARPEVAETVDAYANAPFMVSVTRGPHHVYTFVNAISARVAGRKDLVGKAVVDAYPDLDATFREALDKGAIKTPADLNGLKMRIGGFAGTVLAKLGCVPQQIAGGDIYAALEKGTIDAAEWVGPYDDEKLGFQKVAQFYHYPGWWEGGAMLHNFVNIEKWNALPANYKSLIKTASSLANEWMLAKYDAGNPAALKRLIAGGTQLRPFPTPVMDACLKAAYEVYAEVSAKNADFKKVWASMLAFRNDEYLWWRVAEYTYDDYLIRNRTRT